MALSNIAVVALFGLTALNWTIHWYTQMVTYRLFPAIAERMSGPDFVAYHRAYQDRLPWAIYLPWPCLMAASLLVAALPPAGAFSWAAILLLLNAAIGVLSVIMAVPIHKKIDSQFTFAAGDARGLLRANLARLVVATASLILCTWLAFR